MKNTTRNDQYARIPLEERLKRLEAGNASSPQFSRRIVDAFCDTPVVPALESAGAFTQRAVLCDLLRAHYGWQHAFNVDTTLGDIAVLIAELYLPNGGLMSAERNKKLLTLTAVFFTFFDLVVDCSKNALRHNRLLLRDDINPHLRSVFDFLKMSLDDFGRYARSCGLSHPIRKKCEEFRGKKGYSSAMLPMMLYGELKNDAGLIEYRFIDFISGTCDCGGEQFFDLEDNDPPDIAEFSLGQLFDLINFFICPIAAIHKHRHSGQASAACSKNNTKGERAL